MPKMRRRWIVGGIVVALLASGAILAAQVWSARGARQASVSDAVRNFRDSASAGANPGSLLPEPGVYTYAAEGSETLSVLQTQQAWGPTVPATITPGDASDCYTLRLDFNTNHWQEFAYCSDGSAIRDTGGATFQRFDFGALSVDDRQTFTPTPPFDVVRTAAKPGDAWPSKSVGRNTDRDTTVTASGTQTFIGLESVTIGSVAVPAFHYRANVRLSGSQSGDETTDQWFARERGMLLKLQRTLKVQSPSPIGSVTYTESGAATLTSLVPQR